MSRSEPPAAPSPGAPPSNAPSAEVPSQEPPKVRLSSRALEMVRELMEEEELADGGLRISAYFGAGCSLPLNFDLELDVEPDEGDYVLEGRGIRLFIAPDHAWAVDGLEVDYVDEGAMGSGFAFRHPRGQARRSC